MQVTPQDVLAGQFQRHRAHLKTVAYRMLGSLSEAEDAVQEAWLRLARSDSGDIDNLGGWLTTVVGRVCLDMLRARKSRREEPLEERLPDPLISRAGAADPEQEVLLADSVGLALLVVLESLTPAERLAFVLHDMFGLPFEQIAPIVDRTPVAAKKLASRARQRVRGATPSPDPDLSGQRRVVDAFLAAARGGDFDALLAILDPDVVLRADGGVLTGGMKVIRGAAAVAGQAATFQRMATSATTHPALVNGLAGLVNTIDDQLISVMNFTISDSRIVTIDILSDPDRLARLNLTHLAP
nr:RNA polymerase sigma factor SigJ [Micromonospora citrea]